jgi:hypothetical protein
MPAAGGDERVIVEPTGRRWQISSAGGVDARWHADGKELYYLTLDGQMMAVDIDTSRGFEAGTPRPLFDARITIYPRGDHYAVTKNGDRFLIPRPVDRGNRDPWTVIVNWPQLLNGRPASGRGTS